ncbi:MAG: outer membrane beta-barrel protein [Gemmatimonadaceae bacterium]
MKRFLLMAALAGMAVVSLPFGARAQVSTLVKPVQFGIAAGASIPTGDFGDLFSTGFNGTVTVGLNPQLIPLGIRIDGAYNQFSFKPGDGSAHITSVTGNLVYSIPSAGISPYLIGGAGWYNLGLSDELGGDSENDFGWNVGGGIKLPLSGFDTFIEARFNQVQTEGQSTRFIPITFGILF